jgi:hypothetical protein
MLNTEIIKWAIEEFKPEGFEFGEYRLRGTLTFPDGQWSFLDYTSELFQLMAYPLFLQRVIEGINRNTNIFIQQMKDCIMVVAPINEDVMDSTDYYFKDYDTIDEAKEQAIEYIYKELTE